VTVDTGGLRATPILAGFHRAGDSCFWRGEVLSPPPIGVLLLFRWVPRIGGPS